MKYALVLLVAVAMLGMGMAECDIACTREYDPVCGADATHAETFGNACMFVFYNCQHPDAMMRLVRLGECNDA
uniref:Salivary glands proteinase inhibitor n=1 Tax=Nauphoeta cinerea TaxID=6990 RepID=D2X5N5_NAUCI|nr:salivary glands proteinase inhibitor [Nauphoeta cinerea]